MKTIVLATKNQGKLKEFQALFPNARILDLTELGFQDEIEEVGHSFQENAYIKAKEISNRYHVSVIADDSGLEVDALDGAPGIHSARFAKEHDTEANNRLLIEKMQGVTNRHARFVCAICVYQASGEYKIVEEDCEGWITESPKGTNGFGYDPYFYVDSFHKTFAELSLEEKNLISHRAKALKKVKEICNEDLSFK